MKTEYEIIIDLCREEEDLTIPLNKEELKQLDWPEISWQLSAHRIDCLAAKKRINGLLWGNINKVIMKELYCKYSYNCARNQVIYETILPNVFKIINGVTHDFIFTKGVVCAKELYQNIGNRSFGDIDIIIQKKDLKEIKNALISNGFLCGSYSFQQDSFTAASPEVIKFFELTTHQTHPFVKKVDSLVIDHISIDLNFGLGPESNLKNTELMDSIIARRKHAVLGNIELPIISREDLLLHSCLHIYRDSTVTFHIKDSNDVKLYQYADLYRILKIWNQEFDWEYLKNVICRFNIQNQVYYSLYHCGAIFSEIRVLIEPFLKEIEPSEKGYLDEYGTENVDRGKWELPFAERLFVGNRYKMIKDDIAMKEFKAFKNREKFFEDQPKGR